MAKETSRTSWVDTCSSFVGSDLSACLGQTLRPVLGVSTWAPPFLTICLQVSEMLSQTLRSCKSIPCINLFPTSPIYTYLCVCVCVSSIDSIFVVEFCLIHYEFKIMLLLRFTCSMFRTIIIAYEIGKIVFL